MARIRTETHRAKHRNACFLCCFGASRPEKPVTIVQPDNRESSWFRLKKPASKRTVPIDGAEKINHRSNGKIQTSNSKLKRFSFKLFFFFKGRKPAVASDQAPKDTLRQTTLENQNSFHHAEDSRKIDAVKTGFIQPGSPDVNSISGRTAKLSKSVSLPAPTREKLGNPPSRRTTRREKQEPPAVGLSIITVTLVVLLIWGRACAILCTSAWFYCLPRFRTVSSTSENMVEESSVSDSGDPDHRALVII